MSSRNAQQRLHKLFELQDLKLQETEYVLPPKPVLQKLQRLSENQDSNPDKSSRKSDNSKSDLLDGMSQRVSENQDSNSEGAEQNMSSRKSENSESVAGTSRVSDKTIPVYLPRKWSVSSSCLEDDDEDEEEEDDYNTIKDSERSEDFAFISADLEDDYDEDDYDADEDFDEDFEMFRLNFDYERQGNERSPVPLYEQGEESIDMCVICFDMGTVRARLCCRSNMCDDCLDSYLEYKVNEGVINIPCPNDKCKSFIHRDEILARLAEGSKVKYYRFLVDANKDPCVKTCPRCNLVLTLGADELHRRRKKKKGVETTCSECGLVWCFVCHAPWHDGMTCRQFKKGERLLQKWAGEVMASGQLNAQKCPKCKIFIQRVTGCDHMTCSSCKTSFCYRCGKRYHTLKMFGSHYSRYSPFGCKYNLLPNRPVPRKLIRGAVFGGKLIAGVTLGALAIAAGAVLVGASFIVVPAVVGYKVRKQRRLAREYRRQAERHQLRLAELAAMENRDIFLQDFHQNVRVLIHRQDVDETSLDDPDTGPAVLVTSNVQEVTTEDGYTQYIAHFVSRNADVDPPPLPPRNDPFIIPEQETPDSDSLEEKDYREDEDKDTDVIQRDGSFKISKNMEAKGSFKSKNLEVRANDTTKDSLKSKSLEEKTNSKDDALKSKSLEVKSKDVSKDVQKTKNPEEKAKDTTKDIQKTKSLDIKAKDTAKEVQKTKSLDVKTKDTTKDALKTKSLDNKITKDGGDGRNADHSGGLLDIELNAADTNGCFVNILSKTIHSWQGHETLPKTFGTTKGSLKFSNGTWEKSGKKDRMDIHTFSNLLAIQGDRGQASSRDNQMSSQENDWSSTTHL